MIDLGEVEVVYLSLFGKSDEFLSLYFGILPGVKSQSSEWISKGRGYVTTRQCHRMVVTWRIPVLSLRSTCQAVHSLRILDQELPEYWYSTFAAYLLMGESEIEDTAWSWHVLRIDFKDDASESVVCCKLLLVRLSGSCCSHLRSLKSLAGLQLRSTIVAI